MSEHDRLIINLSFIGQKPTGLATYAINLLPHLSLPNLTLLASAAFVDRHRPEAAYYEIPSTLTPEQGKWGHLHRLAWTQFQVPKLYRKLQASLFFSPIPEAPLPSALQPACPSVVVTHDLIPLRFPSWQSPLTHYARHYIPQVLRQARHIICNSVATAQDICDFYGIAATQITPIPLAHDAQHFRPIAPADLPPPPDRPYFFYIGRPDPYKNLQRLIAAFATIPPDYDLWIAGSTDPRYTPLLQAQAQAFGLADRVKFLNYVTYQQLPVLMNQAIALVFPSLWEGFGFPALEAMACGTPVITSNLSSLPEVVGDAALLVNPYQTEEIAAMMRQVLDSNVRSQLRSAGLARASQFSWAKTGAATAEILQQYL